MNGETAIFTLRDDPDKVMREKLRDIYSALEEKGYNPVNQLVGYILTEDPTYITTHNGARSQIQKLDRDELLQSMVRLYIKK